LAPATVKQIAFDLMKRHSRILGAGFGLVLLTAGCVAGHWWFYKLAPARRLSDPHWLAAHSEKARWEEEQKDYERMGTSPDLCFRGDRIGYYGGKKLFLWLEEQIRNPDDFRYCGCTEYALTLMANRHVTSWKEWTDANRARSQEEWIKDGFLEYGVAVHLPPEPDDTVPLLKLLGRKGWNVLFAGPQGTNAPESVPSYIHYNAYRWLRDSGFHPVRFANSNTILVAESDISRGLLAFSNLRAAFPADDGEGVLAFGKRASASAGMMQPRIARRGVGAGAYAFITGSIIGGLALILATFSGKAGKEIQSEPIWE